MKHVGTIGLGLLVCGAIAPRAGAQDAGVLEPEPLACDADLACPPPLACDEEADGGPVCIWQVIECEDASACPTSFECAEPSRYGDCVQCTGEDGEEVCEPAPCEGPSTCEPEKIACATDSDCPAQWSCVPLLDHPTPGYWNAAEGDVGCVPDGAIALGEGRVGFTTLESGAPDDVIQASATSGPAEDPSGGTGAVEDESAAGDDKSAAMPGAKSSMSASDCSVATPGATRSVAGASVGLLALAWLARCRRSGR